jgi:VIT1/CCC1 family predicted Fe2+/Mn2+ transporter
MSAEPLKQGAEKASPGDLKRFRKNLDDELNGAALYEAMAAAEKDPERASIFAELAETERGHAALWAKKIEDAGGRVPSGSLSLKTRLLAFLSRSFGAASVFPIVQAIEKGAGGAYAGQKSAEALRIARVEKGHAKIFATLKSAQPGSILTAEPWHRRDTGGSLRAAVFGVNDGLVSNFSLIMGVAGASQDTKSILIAGVAGLLAGAFSMGAGEYVSVRSQRELFEHEIGKEEEELRSSPEEEKKELELIYRAKGIPREAAAELAATMLANPQSALDTLAREELGLDPGDLGSPWKVAASSFLAFAAGALIPLLPFLLTKGSQGVVLSAGLAGIALFSVGATLAVFTGRNLLYSGLRMLCIGGFVALVTNGLGRLLGVTLG